MPAARGAERVPGIKKGEGESAARVLARQKAGGSAGPVEVEERGKRSASWRGNGVLCG